MFKTYLQYKNNVQDIYNAKMTYKHLKYVQELAFGRQSCLQRVRKLVHYCGMHWAPLHQSSEIFQGHSHAEKRKNKGQYPRLSNKTNRKGQTRITFPSQENNQNSTVIAQSGERDARKSSINS